MRTTVVPAGLSGPAGAATVDGTGPYPWPWDGRFSPGRCALLVVGDGGVLRPDVDRVVRELSARAQEAGALVVHIATGRPARPARSARPARPGRTSPASPPVVAAGWDGFYGSPLDSVLRGAGRDQLLLAGRLLETGVHSTLRSANDRGYECLTVADACEADSAATGHGALSSITMSGGIFGAIGASSAVLAALTAAAPDPGQPGQPG